MCNSNQGTQFILNEIMYSGIFGLEKLNQIDFLLKQIYDILLITIVLKQLKITSKVL
jgi:hypothetical protein